MPKIDVDTLKILLERVEVEDEKRHKVMEEIFHILKEEEEAKAENPPSVKKQFVIIVSDPDDIIANSEFTGWVVQTPEDESVTDTMDKVLQSVYEFNVTPKGRRLPIKTISEAMETLPTRITKEHSLWIKTKEPIFVLTTDNKIPTIND